MYISIDIHTYFMVAAVGAILGTCDSQSFLTDRSVSTSEWGVPLECLKAVFLPN